MSAPISRNLNVLALAAIGGVLGIAFLDQFTQSDIPCPLCLLQRAAFIGVGLGLAMNVQFGSRPAHYAFVFVCTIAGILISCRHVLLHIAPGSSTYGATILGLHLYVWALLLFMLICVDTFGMLLFEWSTSLSPEGSMRRSTIGTIVIALFCLIAVGNCVSSILECGAGMCPENPQGYLLLD